MYGSAPQNTAYPLTSYATTAGKMTSISDICEQQPDWSGVSSSISHTIVLNSEEGDDTSSSLMSSQLYNVGLEVLRGVDFQQIDDIECIYNSHTCAPMHRNSNSHGTHTAEKPYECDVCHRLFKRHCHLTRHKRIHSGVKPYVCDVCDVAFSRAGDLNRHGYVHSGIKPFTCDICNKAFKHLSDLTKHKPIHSGVKPYVCDVCNKTFSSCGNLSKHKRIHGGFKSFVCDVCERAFITGSRLKRHKIVHSGNKHFKCDICNIRFRHCDNLKMHIETHNNVKRFGCDVCNKMFSQWRYLVAHKHIHSRTRPQSASSPFALYNTLEDNVTFTDDNSEPQPDQRNVSSDVSQSNVVDDEDKVVKEEDDDTLCSEIEYELYNAGHQRFRGVAVQQDHVDALSNAEQNSVVGNEEVNVNVEDSYAISSHLYNAGHEMFRGTDVQQIYDSERIYNSNTCDPMYRSSISPKLTLLRNHMNVMCVIGYLNVIVILPYTNAFTVV